MHTILQLKDAPRCIIYCCIFTIIVYIIVIKYSRYLSIQRVWMFFVLKENLCLFDGKVGNLIPPVPWYQYFDDSAMLS